MREREVERESKTWSILEEELLTEYECKSFSSSVSIKDTDTSLRSSGFVASRRAAQPAEGEERRCEQAPALLAAAAGPGPAPGRERGLHPLGRNHQPARHVRLPPPDVSGLLRRRQAPQRPAASDLGGDAGGEKSITGLRLYFLLGALGTRRRRMTSF